MPHLYGGSRRSHRQITDVTLYLLSHSCLVSIPLKYPIMFIRATKQANSDCSCYQLHLRFLLWRVKMWLTNLAEFLHLFMCVWIQFLRYVLHPEQRSSVFSPGLLHSVHRQPRVWDGSIAKRFDLLVQTAQRVPQSQSVGCSVKRSIKVLQFLLNTYTNQKVSILPLSRKSGKSK